jgi:tetratricopeptide (TPR) repeat protein
VEVAVQLAESAEPGDDVGITTLLEAANVLLTTDPDTAALFGARALDIAPAHHPRRGEIVSTTAIAFHIAGNSDEAIEFVDRALRQTLPSEQEAEVRLGIAGMFAISPDIRIGAGRLALSLPGISHTLRARHLACLFHNLVTSGRIAQARAALEDARDTVDASGDIRASFTLHLAESALEYADDRFGPSLDLVTAAHREGIFAGDDQRLRLGHMWRGEVLSVLDRHDDARKVAADGLESARRDRQGWAFEMFETWLGRLLLRTGQLSEARAVLEGRFDLEDGMRLECSTPQVSWRSVAWRSISATRVRFGSSATPPTSCPSAGRRRFGVTPGGCSRSTRSPTGTPSPLRSGPAQRWIRMGGRSCLGSPWTSPTKCSWPGSRSRPATTNLPSWRWRSHATVLR